MSDVPQGPGWWQASDDKWYPPPRPTMPGEEDQVGVASAPPGGIAPPMGPPSGPGYGPPGAPLGPPSAPMGASAPYGAVPPTPGGGQNRTPLFVALGVVGVLAIGGIALAATSGGDDDDPPPTSIATPGTESTSGPQGTSEPSGPATTAGTPAPSGGTSSSVEGLEVVETGFSNFTDEFDGTNRVSYGYIIENTGDEPVANVEVTVTLKDAEGTVVSSDTDNIYLINPGQRVGLGDEPYEEIATVDAMEVQAAIPSYAGEATALGEITVDGISTTEDGGRWVTTFTAASTYEVQLDGPYAYAVYRNAGGDIVGGSYGFMNIVQAGGSTSGEVSSYSVLPDVDPAQTEVYVDPGYLF